MRDLRRVQQSCAESHPAISRIAAGLFFMIIVYLTTGIFAHFSFIRYFWTMIALATACVCLGARVRKDPAEQEGTVHCNLNIY